MHFRSVAWVNTLRLRYDALTYRWQSWVLGFNRDQQFELLNNLFNGISARKFVLVLIATFLLVLVPVAFTLLRRRERKPLLPQDKYYLQFCDRLGALGLARLPGESAANYAARVGRAAPAIATEVGEITRLYTRLAYAPVVADDPALRSLKRAVAGFRPSGAIRVRG